MLAQNLAIQVHCSPTDHINVDIKRAQGRQCITAIAVQILTAWNTCHHYHSHHHRCLLLMCLLAQVDLTFLHRLAARFRILMDKSLIKYNSHSTCYNINHT